MKRKVFVFAKKRDALIVLCAALIASWPLAEGKESYKNLIIASNPFAYYRFEELDASQPVYDEIGGINSGQYFNGPSLGIMGSINTAPLQNAVFFNWDVSSYVLLTTLNNYAQDMFNGFSVEFWFRSNNSTTKQAILGTNNPGYTTAFIIDIAYHSAGELRLYIRDQEWHRYNHECFAGGCNLDIFDDNWHHIVYSFDPGRVLDNRVYLYIDGNFQPQCSVSLQGGEPSTFTSFTYPMAVGGWNNRGTVVQFLDGGLDELTFYEYPLSSQEVSGHYYAAICTAPIKGDINKDCKIDFYDIAEMLSHWLECNLEPEELCWQ